MTEVPSSPDVAVLTGDFRGLSPEELFAWFTDPARLTKWWPEHAEIDLRVGGGYRLVWPKPEWNLSGEYTAVEAPRHFGFTWKWEHEETPVSQVDVWIDPIDDGSRLAIWHRGFSDAEERRKLCEGWIHFGMRLAGIAEPGSA